MNKFTEFLKTAKSNYPYLVIGMVMLLALVFLSGVNSTKPQPNEVSQNNSLNQSQTNDNSTNVVSNVPETSDEYLELSQRLESSPVANLSIKRTSGSVLSADTNAGGSLAYQSTSAFLINVMGFAAEATGGVSGQSVKGITDDNATYLYYNPSNAFSTVYNLTASLYEPQNKAVSVEIWANDIQQKINPVETVYADDSLQSSTYFPGQGYNLLSPVLPLWQAIANLVYIFYIVIVIIVAFLIVFRSQLDGQNTVNLFNAIPSIIISLVFVYFSYPLSAIFVDFITVGSGVVYGVLIGDDPAGDAPGAFLLEQPLIVTQNFSGQGLNIGTNVELTARTGLQIDDPFVSVWRVTETGGAAPITEDGENLLIPQDAPIPAPIRNLASSVLGEGSLGNIVLFLIFAFASFSAVIRLFFALLKEYVLLSVAPAFAPLLFLIAAIPGRTGAMITMYFRRLFSAALTFIAVYAIFLIIIIIARDNTAINDVLWLPPLLGYRVTGDATQASFVNEEIIRPLIAFGLFITTPIIPDFINNALSDGQGGENPFAQNISQTVKQGAGNALQIGGLIRNAVRSSTGTQPRQQPGR